jgi:hypothetical protein
MHACIIHTYKCRHSERGRGREGERERERGRGRERERASGSERERPSAILGEEAIKEAA